MSPSKSILLCATGLSPQIVTETCFALIQGNRRERVVPDEIHIITTREGKRLAELSLLSQSSKGGRGHFDLLCQDFGLNRESIRFDSDTIHVICDASGKALDDVTDDESNRAAADSITELVRRLTRDKTTKLHVSMAGGRKTMGFFLGYALSLYGRNQDALSHVLVNQPFESHPDFFYPPPKARTLTLRNSDSLVSTAEARIMLADIPFVRMRHGLDQALIDGAAPYSEVVARAQHALDNRLLVIDVTKNSFTAGGQELRLSDNEKLWLLWFARRTEFGSPDVDVDAFDFDDLDATLTLLEGSGASRLRDNVESAIADFRKFGDRNYFERSRTRLNGKLRDQLGNATARIYQIASNGKRPPVYRLPLPDSAIQIRY